MKHVLVVFFEERLDLFFDDVHQGIVSVFDYEIHVGVVGAFIAIFLRVVLKGFQLRVPTDFCEEQDMKNMAESVGPVEEKFEEKVAQEVNGKLKTELL